MWGVSPATLFYTDDLDDTRNFTEMSIVQHALAVCLLLFIIHRVFGALVTSLRSIATSELGC